jgi:hypothetical protein
MARIKVAVSPFYRGEDWTDAGTGIHFEQNEHGVNIYSIPEEADLSGVRRAIRLNTLMLIEGTIPEDVVKELAPEPTPVVEEVKEETVEEAPKETTKSKAKKVSKK